MAIADLFIPQGIQQYVTRPLNGGIRMDVPPQAIPPESFFDVRDGYSEPEGIRRRPSVRKYGDWRVTYPPIQGIWTVRAVSGDSYTIVMDDKYIYKVGRQSLTLLKWVYTTGTCSVATATVTGDGTAWATAANQLNVGDVLVLDADGSGDGPEAIFVKTITDDTTVVLEQTPVGTYGAGTDYEWRRAVTNSVIASPVSVNNKLYIADGSRFISYTDGSTYEALSGDYLWKPYCITYYKDRLWAGHVIDGDVNYRPQIRWTDAGIGNFATWPAQNYVNLPYGFGRVVRLMPMSDFLIAYFTDQLYIGQETNLPLAPVEFRRVDTGGVGLANPYAVAPIFDGNVFVGQDNVYLLSPKGIEPLGDSVVRRTLKRCQAPLQISLTTDYSTSSVLMGVPIDGARDISEIWRFSYKTKAWTREERNANMLMSDTMLESVSWDSLAADLPEDNWNGFSVYYPTWDSIVTDEAWNQQVFFNVEDQLYYYQDDVGAADEDTTTAVRLLLETGDMDLGAPDTVKIWTKLSMQVQDPLDAGESLSFVVEGSPDKGRTWKSLGTLVFSEDHDEASINFRLNGAACRFRFTQVADTAVAPFTVSEVVYYFKVMGGQIASRTDA